MKPTPSPALKPLLPHPSCLHRADVFTQYHASLLTIPDTIRLVPGEAHSKIRLPNMQTAIVTGPEGEEEIYLYGEKDVNGPVRHVWKEHIPHGKHWTVDRHACAGTEGEPHETRIENRKTQQHANDSLTVHGTSHSKVDHKWLRKVSSDVHLYAGDKAVFEAGPEATLKGGGSWMKFDAGGVSVGDSTVRLGGGDNSESRKGAAPLLPVKALCWSKARRGKRKGRNCRLCPSPLPLRILCPAHR